MNRKTAEFILEEFDKLYPHKDNNINFLQFDNTFELLIMTVLSAQTTDVTVNKLKKELFAKYPTPEALASANPSEVEEIIKPAGYYRAKTKNIIAASKMLCEKFEGEVPDTVEELTLLPGVGRKTANIVTNHGFNKVYGIAVDTHVSRLSQRLGFSKNTTPDKIEQDLMKLFDKKYWYLINYLLISHGRAVCTAKKPSCSKCTINNICKSNNKISK